MVMLRHTDLICPCSACDGQPIPRTTFQRHRQDLASGRRELASAAVVQDEPEVQPEVDPARVPQEFDGFCLEMVDLIARNQCNASGMQNVLKVLAKHLRPHLTTEAGNDMPLSLHLLTQRAAEITGVGTGCRSFYRHFCTICGEYFPIDLLIRLCVVPECPRERCTRTGEPMQEALYYDLRDKLERLLSDGLMGSYLMRDLPPSSAGPARKRLLSDVFDGDIINHLRKLWPSEHVIYVAMVRVYWCSLSE